MRNVPFRDWPAGKGKYPVRIINLFSIGKARAIDAIELLKHLVLAVEKNRRMRADLMGLSRRPSVAGSAKSEVSGGIFALAIPYAAFLN
jgi:hypothetical protein